MRAAVTHFLLQVGGLPATILLIIIYAPLRFKQRCVCLHHFREGRPYNCLGLDSPGSRFSTCPGLRSLSSFTWLRVLSSAFKFCSIKLCNYLVVFWVFYLSESFLDIPYSWHYYNIGAFGCFFNDNTCVFG